MGSPLSPITADIVMDDLESKCIASLPFQIPFNFRYVYIITAIPNNKIDTIKNTFNNFNHKIQFTIEEESEGRISFLDVLIIRAGDGIKTNWYHKPTWSGKYLNFNSNHLYNSNSESACWAVFRILNYSQLYSLFCNPIVPTLYM